MEGFIAEAKEWQSLIGTLLGTLLGLGSIAWAAHYNFRLNRRRDDRLREQDGLHVALALYSEVRVLAADIARVANGIGSWYLRYGHSGKDVPAHFADSFLFREPVMYHALASKLGLLPSDVLLPVSEFYAGYEEARGAFHNVLENEERAISYGVEWVLQPAILAIDTVAPALARIEAIYGIGSPADLPDLKKARDAYRLEQETRSD